MAIPTRIACRCVSNLFSSTGDQVHLDQWENVRVTTGIPVAINFHIVC
jgi:hypothetical protein